MKNFEEVEISLKDGLLCIGTATSSGTKSFVYTPEDILRCIKNYFEIYVFDQEEVK